MIPNKKHNASVFIAIDCGIAARYSNIVIVIILSLLLLFYYFYFLNWCKFINNTVNKLRPHYIIII
jgi:hypothetical protein